MTAVATHPEFDVCGPLPSGVTVLEASAGTGKTYAIAALAARYIAEGIPPERLLLITFTRIATGELRDRVRERLVSCEQQLSRILQGAPDPRTDPVVTLLADDPDEQVVALRHQRLARALADFDATTIATTHGFCQEVLAELGTVGDLDPETVFVEDVSELLEEAVDDLYVRRFAGSREGARFTRAEALRIARAAVFNPMAELEPRDEPADSSAAMRYRLAKAIREELERRKRALAVMTYDDLLTRLRDTLAGPSGEAARERLRSRYEVVLVDEFQDTDPVQWQILHHAFAAEGVTLVLIADPKQAIYAFRGADVYAYLVAASTAREHATLRENHRSDQRLLDAYDALFADARLGHKDIVYRRVRAAPANQTRRLTGAPDDAALRVRIVRRDEPEIEQTEYGYARAPSAREYIARDVAADIVALLSSDARIEPGGELRPGHIAVLVRTHRTAELVRHQLHAARVPAVINGAGSVFATLVARDWLRLLEAIERPASTLRATTAAPTVFLGWSAERIATASPAEWEEVHRRLHRWSRILRESGVAALTEELMVSEDLAARTLVISDGERRLTDVRHLAQLLHHAASSERFGVTALRGWLAERIAEADLQDGEEERARRLESDAEAVQVLTIHRSKGLEFPIVYCPFLWDPTRIRAKEPVSFHDPTAGYRHTVDVGLEGRAWNAHLAQHRVEERGEELRLAYVALTRARHQAVIWWAGSYDSRNSPLGRLLFARDADGNIVPEGRSTPTDAAVAERFRELAAQVPGRISVERAALGVPSAWGRPPEPPRDLVAAKFGRELDRRWRRTSYSDITAEAYDPLVSSEPEQPLLADEPEVATPVPPDGPGAADPRLEQVSPFESLPVGVEFGTFVHTVLEAADFAAADLDAELSAHVAAVAGSRRLLDGAEASRAVAALRAAIETPLGPQVDGIRLRDVGRGDRLDEVEFELPLVGGDDPTGRLTMSAIAGALRAHLPAGDPMAAYAARLEDPALRASVRGFLTGSLDLVIRLDSGPPAPRFAIVDYKTNWLGPVGAPLALRHYAPGALAEEMSRAQYGLQALLYSVALHRYLRWRLEAYDADTHFAGVLYLFLRGMAGPATPAVDGTPCGVFAWRPPGRLVGALSDVLDRGGSG